MMRGSVGDDDYAVGAARELPQGEPITLRFTARAPWAPQPRAFAPRDTGWA
jgi:hypothetical protein